LGLQESSQIQKFPLLAPICPRKQQRNVFELLYNAFSVFGQVLAAKVMYDENNTHRGFGFVNFADFDAADTGTSLVSFFIMKPKKKLLFNFV
jgi:hypothetical protein